MIITTSPKVRSKKSKLHAAAYLPAWSRRPRGDSPKRASPVYRSIPLGSSACYLLECTQRSENGIKADRLNTRSEIHEP